MIFNLTELPANLPQKFFEAYFFAKNFRVDQNLGSSPYKYRVQPRPSIYIQGQTKKVFSGHWAPQKTKNFFISKIFFWQIKNICGGKFWIFLGKTPAANVTLDKQNLTLERLINIKKQKYCDLDFGQASFFNLFGYSRHIFNNGNIMKIS